MNALVFDEENVKLILQSGGLDYLDPVSVAKEFLNFQKALKSRKQAIIDAAKISSHFDTTKAFFNDVTHRRNNNRLQPWVDQNTQKHFGNRKKHS